MRYYLLLGFLEADVWGIQEDIKDLQSCLFTTASIPTSTASSNHLEAINCE